MKRRNIGVTAFVLAASCFNPPQPTVNQMQEIVKDCSGTIPAKLIKGLIKEPEFKIKEFRDFYLNQDKKNINVFRYETTKKNANTILFFNTLGEPNNSSVSFAERICEAGYNVLMADTLGTGKSDGERGVFTVEQEMKTIDITREHARKELGGKIIFVGSSHGGEMGYHYACSGNAEKFDCYVFHGIFIPSLDIEPYNLGVKMLIDSSNKPLSGQQIIRMTYPKSIPFGVLVKPENFYTPLEKLVEQQDVSLYNSEYAYKEISDNALYLREIDTESFLAYARKKPDGKLTIKVPVLLLATEGDKVVDFKTRTMHVFTELKKMSDKIDLLMPGEIQYDKRTSKYIPHMAFDTHYRVIANELDTFFRNVYFPEQNLAVKE